MAVTDHYKVLGVDSKATADQIKKAYRSLAKQYHPDKNKSPGAEEKFKAIAAAYSVLSDSDQRRTYDLQQPCTSDRGSRPRPYGHQEPSAFTATGWERFRRSEPEEPHGWERFRTSDHSESTRPSPFRHYFTSSFFTDFSDLFDSPPTRGATRAGSGSKKNARSQFKPSKPTFSFKFPAFERPEWNDHFFDETFDNMDRAFDEFFKDSSFTSMFGTGPQATGSGDEDEEWFDLRTGQRTDRKKPTTSHTSLEDMWDWSTPMFPNKPSQRHRDSRASSRGNSMQLPCIHCGRVMSPSALVGHEATCARFHSMGPGSGGLGRRHPPMSPFA